MDIKFIKSLSIFLLFVSMSILINFENQMFITPIALILALILDRRALRSIFRWKFLVFLSLLVAVIPFLAIHKDARILGLGYSAEMLEIGIIMAQRSMIILLALKIFTRSIPLEKLSQYLQSTRLKHFGSVFSFSLKILPEIKMLFMDSFKDFRRQSGKFSLPDIFGGWVRFVVRLLSWADHLQYSQSLRKDKIK